jgi:hypothetical protein
MLRCGCTFNGYEEADCHLTFTSNNPKDYSIILTLSVGLICKKHKQVVTQIEQLIIYGDIKLTSLEGIADAVRESKEITALNLRSLGINGKVLVTKHFAPISEPASGRIFIETGLKDIVYAMKANTSISTLYLGIMILIVGLSGLEKTGGKLIGEMLMTKDILTSLNLGIVL